MKFSNKDLSDEEIENQSYLKQNPSKYPALRAVSGILSALGYIIIGLCIIGVIYIVREDGPWQSIAIIAGSILIALPLLAFANLIHVLMDIEQNTRELKERMGG